MWIVEKFDDENNLNTDEICYWVNSDAAYKDASASIQREIYYNFDMKDLDCASLAKEINDKIKQSDFKGAVKLWNKNSSTFGLSNFSIYETFPCQDYDAEIPQIFDDDMFEALIDDSEKELTNQTITSTSGATCRGPCKQHNEYACADKSDNTYICHQCKMMNQVFGGSIK